MSYVLGVDVGSGYSKAVVCENSRILSAAVLPSGGNYQETAKMVCSQALSQANLSHSDISKTISTGYGAALVDFAAETKTDMSCHACAVHHFFPTVRTFVDIGTQFTRAVSINEEGRVTYFILNEKCAGGSGKFLQVIARILKVSVEEIGDLSLQATKPVDFTTACAVFAETEAVSRIAEGALPSDIVAGVHNAMASKISTLVARVKLVPDCAITGGGAKDTGLVKALETELASPVLVPDNPQITAAYGAALFAAEQTLT